MVVFLVAADEKEEETEKDVNTEEVVKPTDEAAEQLPHALHKTQSIFLRNLPTLITRQEIEEVCVLFFFSSLFVMIAAAELENLRG